MSALAIAGIGIKASGLPDWHRSRAALTGVEPYRAAPIDPGVLTGLPPTERRRANATSRLAIAAALQAVEGLSPSVVARLPTVFASADGDGELLAQMLAALSQPAIALSPTLFHNSVFNAPAGYWSLAYDALAPSTAICGGTASFAVGLLEAYSQVLASRGPVLYIAFDMRFPKVLSAFELSVEPFACALLLRPAVESSSAACGSIDGWSIRTLRTNSAALDAALVNAFARNAASAALQLLATIAAGAAAPVSLPYLDDTFLELAYSP